MSRTYFAVELFRANLRRLREREGLTQGELAERLGVNRTAVTQWESGWSTPNLRRLPAFASALDCEVADLFEPITDTEERVA